MRVLPSGVSPLVHAETGHDISLVCDYELEDDILYSIKWYRDDKEFYRFRPRGGMMQSMIAASFMFFSFTESPPVTTYFLPGVSVMRRSSPTHLIIHNISSSTSGIFKCEVSAGPPR